MNSLQKNFKRKVEEEDDEKFEEYHEKKLGFVEG